VLFICKGIRERNQCFVYSISLSLSRFGNLLKFALPFVFSTIDMFSFVGCIHLNSLPFSFVDEPIDQVVVFP
jgi:hypothetical protein